MLYDNAAAGYLSRRPKLLLLPARGLGDDADRDQRLAYFDLVGWVNDPFGRPPIAEPATGILLNDRYLIEGALRFSNAGGIYHGSDTATGEPVIVKEARPLTNSSTIGGLGWDAVYFLKREYDMLSRLQNLDFIP